MTDCQKKSVCIVCSSGGHLTEALNATAEIRLSGIGYYIVTPKGTHLKSLFETLPHYFVVDPHRNLGLYLVNFFQSLTHLIKGRPKVIITTGAGVAIPTCLLGKLFGARLVLIETAARIETPSKTSKLLYLFADKTYVQWESLLQHLPKAEYGGVLI